MEDGAGRRARAHGRLGRGRACQPQDAARRELTRDGGGFGARAGQSRQREIQRRAPRRIRIRHDQHGRRARLRPALAGRELKDRARRRVMQREVFEQVAPLRVLQRGKGQTGQHVVRHHRQQRAASRRQAAASPEQSAARTARATSPPTPAGRAGRPEPFLSVKGAVSRTSAASRVCVTLTRRAWTRPSGVTTQMTVSPSLTQYSSRFDRRRCAVAIRSLAVAGAAVAGDATLDEARPRRVSGTGDTGRRRRGRDRAARQQIEERARPRELGGLERLPIEPGVELTRDRAAVRCACSRSRSSA